MRTFYLTFPNWNAVRTELSWTHYRILLGVEDEHARAWYLKESIEHHWSSRALERQISVLYYERLLASQLKKQDPIPVISEANAHIQANQESILDYLRDPYILDFLNLQDKSYQETDIEQAIISHIQQFLLELGKGFAFIERQQRIRFDDEDFTLTWFFIILNLNVSC